jgi:acetyl esterase
MTSYLDPRIFDESAIDPEIMLFNKEIEKMQAKVPPVHTLPPQQVREVRESGQTMWGEVKILDEVEERKIPGREGDVTVRIYVPEHVRGIYMHMHGGGFMFGRAHHYDEISKNMGDHCQIAVVSVDYRLAPEQPYPAAPDDCEAVALWLAYEAKSEFGTDNLIIGGESAGANLSVVTLVRLRDRHKISAFCGANLLYGVFDLSMTPSCRRWGDRRLMLTTPTMEYCNRTYAPNDKHTNPDISPLYADLQGLPPAFFTVGTLDPLLDDSIFMHARWIAGGNQAELGLYPGGTHIFERLPTNLAEKANNRIYDFIHKTLEENH